MKGFRSLCCGPVWFAAVLVIAASSPHPAESLVGFPSAPGKGGPSSVAQVLKVSRNRNRQCAHESAAVDLLQFPLASPGESFGVLRRFQPFRQRALESSRLHAVSRPSCH
ncbi:hypothetical protein PBY51_025073 [Eleginops maclovinus]|uniref:Secreted protein n=1 Tax=Eleginops maclovinus TaxID=56733 RepID=A0AAN7XXV2_ELEMC|nr:hypothetical protein PBY51_025073 [Eleginops maclovinus]